MLLRLVTVVTGATSGASSPAEYMVLMICLRAALLLRRATVPVLRCTKASNREPTREGEE